MRGGYCDGERVMLVLVGLLGMGATYCYDNPSALKSQLQHHFASIPVPQFEVYFNLFYTVYSIPNMVLPFFGGILCDRWGPRNMLVALTTLVLVGQVIFALGSSTRHISIMLIGRFVFGLAGETIPVAQCSLVATWFPSNKLALVMGLLQSASRLGTVLNNAFSPLFAYWFHVSGSLWLGAAFCVVSVFVATLAKKLDERHLGHVPSSINSSDVTVKPAFRVRDLGQLSRPFWLITLAYVALLSTIGPYNNVASSVLLERDYFKLPPPNCRRCGVGEYAGDPTCAARAPACPSTPPYAPPLPLLSAACDPSVQTDGGNVSVSSCHVLSPGSPTSIIPLIEDAQINCDDDAWRYLPATQDYCHIKFRALQAAAVPLSIPSFVFAITAPAFGFFVDSIGFRPALAAIAHGMVFVVHFLLGWTSVAVAVPLAMQGLATCLFASAMWPAIPYCVEDHQVGTAYGIVTACWNLGLAIVPLGVAEIVNWTQQYLPHISYLFCAFALVGFTTCVALALLDEQTGCRLSRRTMTKPRDAADYLVHQPLVTRAQFRKLQYGAVLEY